MTLEQHNSIYLAKNLKIQELYAFNRNALDRSLVQWCTRELESMYGSHKECGRMRFIHAKGSWHSCEVGRGQGSSLHLCCWSLEGFLDGALFSWFDLVQLPSNSSITHLNSHGHWHFLLSLWFFPSLSHGKEIFKCNPSLMAGQHQFQSNCTEIFTFYILNTREIDTACRSPGGFEVMEHLRSSHQLQLLPWHPGMNTDKGIKRWTDLMHGRDTAVPSNLSRLKSTQIRHYCLTRNYRLHCRSKEKRTNPDRIHNNYFTCLEEHENGSTDTSVCGGNVVFIGSGGVMSEWGRLVMFYWER